jgi:Zn-dependent protease
LLITYVGFDRSIGPYVDALIRINVLLAVFNLLPIPPLDGFGFLFGLSPMRVKVALAPVLNLGPLILLAFLFLPGAQQLLGGFLSAGSSLVNDFLEVLAGGA